MGGQYYEYVRKRDLLSSERDLLSSNRGLTWITPAASNSMRLVCVKETYYQVYEVSVRKRDLLSSERDLLSSNRGLI
jgi:hypothetical protein